MHDRHLTTRTVEEPLRGLKRDTENSDWKEPFTDSLRPDCMLGRLSGRGIENTKNEGKKPGHLKLV